MWAQLRELIFPRSEACLWCGRPEAPSPCETCRRELAVLPPARCPRCLRPVRLGPVAGLRQEGIPGDRPGSRPARCWSCRVRPPAVSGMTCLGLYRGLLRWTIHAVKGRGQRFLLPPLAEMMARGLQADGAVFDLVTVPPLDPRRLRRRGFHPALALADRVAARSGRPFVPFLLRRNRPVRPQSGLTGAERRHNLRGTVRVARWAQPRLRGRRVLLVDDVITTGSTLDAAARALLAAGAAAVWAVVAADNGSRRVVP